MTCPVCGGGVPLTTYNWIYCSIRCRRDAGQAKERAQQRAGRAADWTDFWAAIGDVPSQADAAIAARGKLLAVK